MKSTPSTWLILKNDYWCFFPGLLLVVLPAVMLPISLLGGHVEYSLRGDALVLLAAALALLLIAYRVRRIRDVLENGKTVQASVLSATGANVSRHLRAQFAWQGDTRAKTWILNRLARELKGRIELRVDPENPRRAYPVAIFCRREQS